MKTLNQHKNELISKLNAFIENVTENQTHRDTIWLFQKAVALWVIGNMLLLFPGAQEFWGINAFVVSFDFNSVGLLEKPLYLLNHPGIAPYFYVFIGIQVLSATLLLFGKYTRLASTALFLATMNLDNKAAVILDGGNNLMHILLFFNMFLSSNKSLTDSVISNLSNSISNVAFFACRVQVAFVYLVAGIGKVTGTLWPKGVALYYTMNVNEYSHPLLGELMSQFPIATTLGSYATLIFQLSFPFLIWYRKPRAILLMMGTGFHLGIVFGMGLVSFGVAMCVSYFIFYPNEKSYWFRSLFSSREKLIVGFDEQCAICQKFANIMQRLNWQGKLISDGAHQPINEKLAAIPLSQRLKRIQLIKQNNGETLEGLEALGEVFYVNPITVPIGLALKGLCFIGLGDKVYDLYIANNSWRKNCQEGVCEI